MLWGQQFAYSFRLFWHRVQSFLHWQTAGLIQDMLQEYVEEGAAFGEAGYAQPGLEFGGQPAAAPVMDAAQDYAMPTEGAAGFETAPPPPMGEFIPPATDFASGY